MSQGIDFAIFIDNTFPTFVVYLMCWGDFLNNVDIASSLSQVGKIGGSENGSESTNRFIH